MVNTEKFGRRIQKIMDHYGISASTFADATGVGRSSISHILSGRNKPSLDFVMKIVDAYREVSLSWLLYEKGNFPSSEKSDSTSAPSIQNSEKKEPQLPYPENDLFNSIDENPINQKKSEVKENTANKSIIEEQESEISRMVIFYKDGSFEDFVRR